MCIAGPGDRRLTGPPWHGKLAPDVFHPNDAGYAHWCEAFAEAIGLA